MKSLKGKSPWSPAPEAASGANSSRVRAKAPVVLADIDEAGKVKPWPDRRWARAPSRRAATSRSRTTSSGWRRAYEQFAPRLLFNNAGVAVAGPAGATLEDWRALEVNLMGVVHGIRSFVPRMLAQKDECHVVNTASVAGLLSLPGSGVYCVSKHGVVTLSECLLHDLRVERAPIGVSVLCPAYVNTGIGESARNRPREMAATNPLAKPYEEAVRKALLAGKLSAEDVARITLEAVKEQRFYVLPHQKIKAAIETTRPANGRREPADVCVLSNRGDPHERHQSPSPPRRAPVGVPKRTDWQFTEEAVPNQEGQSS